MSQPNRDIIWPNRGKSSNDSNISTLKDLSINLCMELIGQNNKATLDLAYNFEIKTSCTFVDFVLILELSCSFRLKRRQLVLGVIVALAFNTVGFRGDDCQVSPVRSLKTLVKSQSLPFPAFAISLVTRQHNIWPYYWNCATTNAFLHVKKTRWLATPVKCCCLTTYTPKYLCLYIFNINGVSCLVTKTRTWFSSGIMHFRIMLQTQSGWWSQSNAVALQLFHQNIFVYLFTT
jgi:hypothetical protein